MLTISKKFNSVTVHDSQNHGGSLAPTFDSVYEAGVYCDGRGEIADNAEGIGYKLGGMIVAINEGTVSLDDVIEALNDATDPAYTRAAHDLGRALLERFGK